MVHYHNLHFILQVPFLDVCNTLLHPILPLTAIDYEEFGFPVDHEEFLAIKKYSPYDNIQKDVPYPAVFVTSSFNTRYALPGYRVMPGPLGSAVYLAKLASPHYSIASSIIVCTPHPTPRSKPFDELHLIPFCSSYLHP